MVAGVQIGYYCVTSPIAVWLFTRPSQSLGKVYWQLCAVPIFCSALALAPGLLLVHKLSWLQRHDVLQIALVSLSATLLYLALIRLAAREPWNEMMRLVSQWLPSRRRHGAIQA